MTSKGGFHDYEIVDGGPLESVKCFYCTGILRDAMELPCGHLICGPCLQNIARYVYTVDSL